MPTITAQTIMNKAKLVLNDAATVRWTEAELLGWLNDGQREIVALRPDAYANIANITLVAGSLQTIPAEGYQLLDVIRNMGAAGTTPGRAIRVVPRPLLDAQVPDWHTSTPSAVTLHYVFDPRFPKRFYVYPQAVAGQRVEAVYSIPPPDVALAANTITLDDIYANILLDYILYRAFSKDYESSGTADKAAAARSAFENSLGLKAQADAAGAALGATKG